MTTPETPESTAQVRVRPRRRRGSPLDMVRSLGLVGIFVVGMVAFSQSGQPERPPVTVDIAATVTAARADADFPVLAMQALPKGWYANFAEYTPAGNRTKVHAFHIGYVTLDEQYFGVDVVPASSTEERTDPVVRSESVAGLTFAVHAGDGRETWIHAADATAGYTILLTGTGSSSQWQEFTSALSAEGATAW